MTSSGSSVRSVDIRMSAPRRGWRTKTKRTSWPTGRQSRSRVAYAISTSHSSYTGLGAVAKPPSWCRSVWSRSFFPYFLGLPGPRRRRRGGGGGGGEGECGVGGRGGREFFSVLPGPPRPGATRGGGERVGHGIAAYAG